MTPASATATLHLSQTIPDTPGQSDKQPMVLPLKTALIGADSGAQLGEERLVLLDEPKSEHHVRGRRRAALAVDQPRFLGAGPDRGRRAGRASSSGWPKSIPTRSPATRRCRN